MSNYNYETDSWDDTHSNVTPCDTPDEFGHYHCPFQSSEDDYISCRDYCGLGVDE